ncbi:hypothetical protein [Flavisolibacter nicotianae]|uniref:hypothetical protein n=1 Tax=Flavisolibacter nicotianae TaxID=2364882 RepID=UPI0013C4737D|nr:hypothetical protein [Flavisolibacter nicotianae]
MLDIHTCKQILTEGEEQYKEEEVKMISELLWRFAELSVETYEELLNDNKQ